MRYSRNEVTAGAVILAAIVVLTVFLVVVGKFESAIVGSHVYCTRFDDAALIREGSPVAVNGVKCGQVLGIKLVEETPIPGNTDTRVEITFEVPKKTPLRKGA